jgi:hypothetical protein
VDWGSRILCPACLEIAEKNTTLLVRERPLFDSIALGVAGLSIVLYVLSLLIAPIVIVLAIVAFRKPGSIVRRNRVRAWIAIVIAMLQLGGWAWLITYSILRMPG